MPGEWPYWDVLRVFLFWTISTKRISALKLSVLVHQMCVLDTKKLVAYSFSLGETSPKNVL